MFQKKPHRSYGDKSNLSIFPPSPDQEENPVRRNFYKHDNTDEIETKIVPFDRNHEIGKERDDKFLDEDGNGIKDIDEEAELVA